MDTEIPYSLDRDGSEKNLSFDYTKSVLYPSIEDNEETLERTMNTLVEVGRVTNITFKAERNYIYDLKQVNLLNQLGELYVNLTKVKNIMGKEHMGEFCPEHYPKRLFYIRKILLELFKRDPIGSYVETVRLLRKEEVEDTTHPNCKKTTIKLLETIKDELEKSDLIQRAKPYLAGHIVGDRKIYRHFFIPQIRPNFMYTRLMAEPPLMGEELESYTVGEDTDVTIYKLPEKARLLYHINPPEFKLSEDEYVLLDETRDILLKYKPKEEEFIDPQRMRDVFFNISKDLLTKIAEDKKISLNYDRLQKLSKILVRLTVGVGLVEVMLKDARIEDIYLNAPVGTTPLYLKHADYGECETNVFPNPREVDTWATRFRMISSRPLDEANPVLDFDLELPEVKTRIATVQTPLSPKGVSIAFRRHRERPFTLPLLIKFKALTPYAAGLLSFLVDGNRSFLIAGTRGSGKTSLLSAMMVEIMRKFRVITVEDTLELPTDYLRRIGYNILPIKVRSAISGETSEFSADKGLRTTLRLGDSSLVIGEVRSEEAKALYEAMRVGALANVVMGTIHGDSPYGVFDRVVNDLGVPKTSFKATDIVIIANKIKTPDQLSEIRRITSITEVRKHWENDPMLEKGFLDLMVYDAVKDMLLPSKELLEGDSDVVKSIAINVKDWIGNWDAVLDNIQLRADSKKLLVDYAQKIKNDEILEADFVVDFNDAFHMIYSQLKLDYGKINPSRFLRELEDWIKQKVKEGRYA